MDVVGEEQRAPLAGPDLRRAVRSTCIECCMSRVWLTFDSYYFYYEYSLLRRRRLSLSILVLYHGAHLKLSCQVPPTAARAGREVLDKAHHLFVAQDER